MNKETEGKKPEGMVAIDGQVMEGLGEIPDDLDMPVDLAIKRECLECPCFATNGCRECDELSIAGLEGSSCMGDYPDTCDPEDCVAAKRDLQILRTNAAVCAIVKEWKEASESEPPISSPYEAHGMIAAHLADLLVETRQVETTDHGLERIREILTRIAATALRTILDGCPHDVVEDIKGQLGIGDEDSSSEEAPPNV